MIIINSLVCNNNFQSFLWLKLFNIRSKSFDIKKSKNLSEIFYQNYFIFKFLSFNIAFSSSNLYGNKFSIKNKNSKFNTLENFLMQTKKKKRTVVSIPMNKNESESFENSSLCFSNVHIINFYNLSRIKNIKTLDSNKISIFLRKIDPLIKKKSLRGFNLLKILILNYLILKKSTKNKKKIKIKGEIFSSINKDKFYFKEEQKMGKIFRKCFHFLVWKNEEIINDIRNGKTRKNLIKILSKKIYEILCGLELSYITENYIPKIKNFFEYHVHNRLFRDKMIYFSNVFLENMEKPEINEYGCEITCNNEILHKI